MSKTTLNQPKYPQYLKNQVYFAVVWGYFGHFIGSMNEGAQSGFS